MKMLIRNNKGITLPELVVAAALIGVVIMTIVAIMFWSNNSFQMAEKETILHREVRDEANYITEQIRRAKYIEVLDGIDEEDLEEGYNYIYLKDGKVMKQVSIKSSNYIPMVTEVYITDLNFYTDENNLIRFYVTGELRKKGKAIDYTIDSKVVADSIKYGTFIESGKSGHVIKYIPKALGEVGDIYD